MVLLKIKSLKNEKGFTLVEVLIATTILTLISLPIFYNSIQSTNNYISAEKYYQATLDAQNILEELKSQLDKDTNKFISNSISKSDRYKLENSDSLFELLILPKAEYLGLEIDRYKYNIYLKNYETEKDSVDGETILPYGLEIHDDGTIILENKNKEIKSPVYLDLDTYNFDFDIDLNIDIKNYSSDNIELNIYSNKDVKYNPLKNLKAQSYSTGGIHVNFYTDNVKNQKTYIIEVEVVDSKNQRVLKKLMDMYSYIPNY